MTPARELWSRSVGFLPWKVTVYENAERKGVLYLRWREGGNWKKRSLNRPLRTPRGKIDPEAQAWALEQAAQKYANLVNRVPEHERPAAPLTIAQGLARAMDPETGKYPADTPHRREVKREVSRAIACLGPDTAWESIRRADLRRLWRWRIQQLRADGEVGRRGAEVTVQRFLAIASWLREEEIIPPGACVPPKNWKELFLEDWLTIAGPDAPTEPERPRHSLEDMRKLIAAAGRVDPRFELLMALGAELRLGQVIRARRSDLDLSHRTLTIRGRKNKRGVVVKLTDGQMRAVDRALHPETGYLRELEQTAADYPLFPSGQMPGGRAHARGFGSRADSKWRVPDHPVATVERHAAAPALDRSVIDDWFRETEELAGVAHIPGRGAYGLRRRSVDEVKKLGISREGLQASGGWTDTQMPDRIYADQQQEYAQNEAAEARAKVRGETE